MAEEDTQQAVRSENRMVRIEASLEQQGHDIAELRAYLTQVLAKLERRDENQEKQIQERVLFCAARSPLLDQTVGELAALRMRVKELEKLAPAMRAVIWIGGVLGVSVLALIWAIITGQAQIIFP